MCNSEPGRLCSVLLHAHLCITVTYDHTALHRLGLVRHLARTHATVLR